MLTVVLTESHIQAAHQIRHSVFLADAYEFRLDTFQDATLHLVADLMKLLDHITIFTYRMKDEGGFYEGNYEDRWSLLEPYLSLHPSYVDLEVNTPDIYIERLRQNYPHIKLILSYHNMEKTPSLLEKELEEMLQRSADVYKFVAQAHSVLDALNMLFISLRCKKEHIPFVGICIGEYGALTRLLAPVMGHVFTYCNSESGLDVALGQICIEELCSVYRHKKLNTFTKIYALLGHPVYQSPSHYTHNKIFDHLGINAIYVKIDIFPEDFFDAFQILKQLPFEGFSVTVPFKEKTLKLTDMLEQSAQEIEAVNTLYKREGKWIGTNTDYQGAVQALQKYVCLQGQRCLIIGAGGTAKAIAYGALKQGAFVTVLNRTKEKAVSLAKHLGCLGMGFDELDETLSYDILINTTTVGSSENQLLEEKYILNDRTVMDVLLNPVETPLLFLAKQKGCNVVYGYTMFLCQAAEQFRCWTQIPLRGVEQLLEHAYFDFKARTDALCSSRNL